MKRRTTVLMCAATLLALPTSADTWRTAQKPKQAALCWSEPEVKNPDPAKHKPTLLPDDLAHAKVDRSVLLLKACVLADGTVDRVLVLESSGNPKVDAHYVKDLSGWTFAPVTQEGHEVRSVVSVAVTLYLKR